MDTYFVMDQDRLPRYIDWIYKQAKKTRPYLDKKSFGEYLKLYYVSQYRLSCLVLRINEQGIPLDAYACSLKMDEFAQVRADTVHVGVEVDETEITNLHSMDTIMTMVAITLKDRLQHLLSCIAVPFPYSEMWDKLLTSSQDDT